MAKTETQVSDFEIKEPSPKVQKLDQNSVHGAPELSAAPLLKVKKLSEKAAIPSSASPLSAGYDLSSATQVEVPAGGKALVPTDLSMAVPLRTYALTDIESGLIDGSLLVLQRQHRSQDVWEATGHGRGDSTVLTCRRTEAALRRRGAVSKPVAELVQQAGLAGLLEVSFIALDWHLITALVERWRPETHTFHLRSGEATVTLQDVELLLGLPVHGKAVTGTTNQDWDTLCLRLLGVSPPHRERVGGRIRLTWLRQQFTGVVPVGAAPEQVAQQARGYLLQLLGGTVFADNSGQFVHLMYLPLLDDFAAAGDYSWGSAALAVLYSQLCHGSRFGAKDVGVAFVLLQVWAWDHLPHLAPRRLGRVLPPPGAPLIARWRDDFTATNLPTHVVSSYRYTLDQQRDEEVVWVPYTPTMIAGLPAYCRAGVVVWRACVPLVCFATVEVHQPDRVLRQFGFWQSIPGPSLSLQPPHGQDLRSGVGDWRITPAAALRLWDQRLDHVVPLGAPDDSQYPPDDPYRVWYDKVTRRFISRMGACMEAMFCCSQRLIAPDLTLEEAQDIGRKGMELVQLQHSLLRMAPPPPVPVKEHPVGPTDPVSPSTLTLAAPPPPPSSSSACCK